MRDARAEIEIVVSNPRPIVNVGDLIVFGPDCRCAAWMALFIESSRESVIQRLKLGKAGHHSDQEYREDRDKGFWVHCSMG